jgi:uncharacterized protein YdcH (DUF465 family)
MTLEHHPLIAEFPAHKDAIHRLKMEDRHFHKLMEKYEEVDKQIVRIEENIEPTGDVYLENLKKERLALKDQIYSMLKAQ